MTLEKEILIQKSLNEIRVKSLYKGVTSSVFVGTFAALFIFFYLYQDIPYMGHWLTVLIIGALIRIVLYKKYRKNINLYTSEKWINLHHYATSFVALSWGALPLLLLFGLPLHKELIVITTILGLVTGGVISNIASKKTAYVYSVGIVSAFALKMMIERSESYLLFIGVLFLFIILLFKMIKIFNDLFERSQRYRIDLEEKLGIEKELQQEKLRSLQNSKLASLGEMATGIAHEINNPLTVAIGKLEIFKRIIPTEKFTKENSNELIATTLTSLRRISDIVGSMKNLSRMKDEAELQDFCISELVDIVKPLVQSKLKHSSILLIEDFENFDVKSDKGEVSQVLLNLIHNAADAIGGTEDKKWIKLSSFKKSGYVYLSVSDSGEGIPQDKISKIFQPFFTTKEVGEGTGLGLSLSKNIMTRNGGDLEYDSESLNTTFNMKMKNSDS